MKILVTGARGLVGKLVVATAEGDHDVRGLGRSELDVTDRAAVAEAVREFSPALVLHCAAYTDVDGAENDPERAMTVNADGTQSVAEAARDHGASLIYVSTDYVFDGTGTTPYREDDETAPLSVYGRSKLEGERRVDEHGPESAAIVRTGWLYGTQRGFVDWVRGRLDAGGSVPVVRDQTGSPTHAGELARALVRLAEMGARGRFHFVNCGEATWLDAGRAVAEVLGHDSNRLQPIDAASLGRPAPRPSYSALSVVRYEQATGQRVPGWRDALTSYLNRRKG